MYQGYSGYQIRNYCPTANDPADSEKEAARSWRMFISKPKGGAEVQMNY